VPEPGFYDITLDPLGNPWISAVVHESCPADFTGSDGNPDGVVNVVDLLALLASWGLCEDCPVDINGDGVVNVTDLLELLAAWGDCPEV